MVHDSCGAEETEETQHKKSKAGEDVLGQAWVAQTSTGDTPLTSVECALPFVTPSPIIPLDG